MAALGSVDRYTDSSASAAGAGRRVQGKAAVIGEWMQRSARLEHTDALEASRATDNNDARELLRPCGISSTHFASSWAWEAHRWQPALRPGGWRRRLLRTMGHLEVAVHSLHRYHFLPQILRRQNLIQAFLAQQRALPLAGPQGLLGRNHRHRH